MGETIPQRIRKTLQEAMRPLLNEKLTLEQYNALKTTVLEVLDPWDPSPAKGEARYIIIDVEATCWENLTHNDMDMRDEMEIIEIGAVIVSSDFKVMGEFSTFVKPTLHEELSEFCKQLTHISQNDVDTAGDLQEALFRLKCFVNEVGGKFLYELVFCSWGDFDRKQFSKDCDLNRIEYPFGSHKNLSYEFREGYKTKKCGLRAALTRLGLKFEGEQHRALPDAINIAKIFIHERGMNYPS